MLSRSHRWPRGVHPHVADVLATPDSAPEDHLAAEQGVELLKDGFAELSP